MLAIDIGTFLFAVLAVLVVRERMKPGRRDDSDGSWTADLREGWRAIASRRGVALLIFMISAVTFFLGFLQTLIAPMVLSFADARTLGAIQSVSAVGMLASSLLIGMISVGRRYAGILAVGLTVAGLAMALMGLTTNTYAIIAGGFLFLSALPFVNMSADVLVRRNIPNEKQGRVWGMVGVLSQLGFIAAYAIAGPLADHVFNPLLEEGGLLASSVGRLVGVGPERGIGFLFVIAGLLVVAMAAVTYGFRSIRALEKTAANST